MKTALVHEWLTTFAGAENVIEQMFPLINPASLFVLVDYMKVGRRPFLDAVPIETSFIQRLPFSRTKYRGYLPFMPVAVEQFDFSEFDVVISSHYCVAHGVLTRPDQPHLVYTHSPVRYAWDLQHQYLEESGLAKKRIRGAIARAILHYLRVWDRSASQRPDFYAANSQFIADRINKYYRRHATVVYPPVDVQRFQPATDPREDFYLTASRMVPYKKISMIARAFARMPHRKLVIIGDGPEFRRIQAEVTPNISLLGYQGNNVLVEHLQKAKAFVFAAREDFGILPVEAQACGTPVIALGKGGTAETIIDSKTGVLFGDQTEDCLIQAVERFESIRHTLHSDVIRANAERFSNDRFRQEFSTFVDRSLDQFRKRQDRVIAAQ